MSHFLFIGNHDVPYLGIPGNQKFWYEDKRSVLSYSS